MSQESISKKEIKRQVKNSSHHDRINDYKDKQAPIGSTEPAWFYYVDNNQKYIQENSK